MQILPLLTPTHYNTKKRPRSYTDDFESHYLKKRLISTMKPDFKPMTPPISSRGNATSINTTSTPRIHMLNVNGTMLPMEQKPGQSKYTIPDFVLSDKPKNLLSGPLVLYQKSTLCQSPTITELSDSDSITSEEFDEEYEPMDLD